MSFARDENHVCFVPQPVIVLNEPIWHETINQSLIIKTIILLTDKVCCLIIGPTDHLILLSLKSPLMGGWSL